MSLIRRRDQQLDQTLAVEVRPEGLLADDLAGPPRRPRARMRGRARAREQAEGAQG